MQQPLPNITEYTVSEISAALKRTVEDAFGYVRVRGEISGYRGPHSSGHAYFALKDDRARLEACIWRTTLQRLRFRPEEGMEVVATGRLTTFPGSSKYQIVIDTLAPAGVGALMALLEERRKKLAAEGLFAEARKKPLPYLPRVIGVVTSPTGAVIRDILHRLTDRFPVRVVLWPVRVQGETSAAEVAAAIRGFNALPEGGHVPRPDLLIVARGGGSLEDLWSFNEEIVVRAAAASKIPLISAVGHETDWTLIDHAADKRAPTPTGAAEMAVPVRSELLAAVNDLSARHFGAMARGIESRRREFRGAARALPSLDDLLAIPRRAFDELASRLGRGLVANAQAHRIALTRTASQLSVGGLARLVERGRERLVSLSGRNGQAFARRTERLGARLAGVASHLDVGELEMLIERRRERVAALSARKVQALGRGAERLGAQLEQLAKLLEAFSYRSILERGFALVHAGEAPIRSAAAVKTGMRLAIEFHDGSVGALAGGVPPVRRKKGTPEGQGSLF